MIRSTLILFCLCVCFSVSLVRSVDFYIVNNTHVVGGTDNPILYHVDLGSSSKAVKVAEFPPSYQDYIFGSNSMICNGIYVTGVVRTYPLEFALIAYDLSANSSSTLPTALTLKTQLPHQLYCDESTQTVYFLSSSPKYAPKLYLSIYKTSLSDLVKGNAVPELVGPVDVSSGDKWASTDGAFSVSKSGEFWISLARHALFEDGYYGITTVVDVLTASVKATFYDGYDSLPLPGIPVFLAPPPPGKTTTTGSFVAEFNTADSTLYDVDITKGKAVLSNGRKSSWNDFADQPVALCQGGTIGLTINDASTQFIVFDVSEGKLIGQYPVEDYIPGAYLPDAIACKL